MSNRFFVRPITGHTMGSFTVQKDVLSGQSKGCALCVQFRYTRLLWHPRWATHYEGAPVEILLAAPQHNLETGYHCTKWGVSWRRPCTEKLGDNT